MILTCKGDRIPANVIATSSAINKKLEIDKTNSKSKLEIYSYFKLEFKLEIFEFFVNGR